MSSLSTCAGTAVLWSVRGADTRGGEILSMAGAQQCLGTRKSLIRSAGRSVGIWAFCRRNERQGVPRITNQAEFEQLARNEVRF